MGSDEPFGFKVPYIDTPKIVSGLWHDLFGGDSKKPPPGPNQWGEPAKPSTKTSPVDYIAQYLSGVGAPSSVTPQWLYGVMAARDPSVLKSPDKLQTALNQYADHFGWTNLPGQASTGATNVASIVDPLAVQAFFQQTIAPYLQQVAATEGQAAQRMRSAPLVQGLPAGYQAAIKQGEITQANDMDALQQATMAASATQPQIAMLNQMLGLAQKASLQDYYAQRAAGVGGGTTPALPSGGW